MSSPHQLVEPTGMYRPAGYAHAIKAGNVLYVAGQVARDEAGELVGPDDAAVQAQQVYENLGRVLVAAGVEPQHVVKITTYLVDPEDGQAAAAARSKFFGAHRPPHTGLIVKALGGPEVRLEVEVIAVLP